MGKLMMMLGACVAMATGVWASEAMEWFAEDAGTVAEAIVDGGESPDGVWFNYDDDQLTTDEGKVVVDADDESAVAYRPNGALTDTNATIVLTDIVFGAARSTLPELPDDAQAAVAVTTNANGECVFAVAGNGKWEVTMTTADPTADYAVKVDFNYADGGKTVGYSVSNETGWVTLKAGAVNPKDEKVSRVEFSGCGSFATFAGAYPPVSDPLPDPSEVDTDAKVQEVMADAATTLKGQITKVADYANFYKWVTDAKLDHATAKGSDDAFFSFATAQAKLVDTAAVSNGAVRIISMATSALGTADAPTNVIGVAVEIKGVRVGETAQSKYLDRVFGAAGATDPAGPFSAGTISLAKDREGNAMTPMWGCVIFYAIPNMYLMKQPTGLIIMPGQGEETSETPSADQFFLKATVNPNPPPPGQTDPFIPSDPQAAMKEHCEEDPGLQKVRNYPYEG